jgi:hypothetical protein
VFAKEERREAKKAGLSTHSHSVVGATTGVWRAEVRVIAMINSKLSV